MKREVLDRFRSLGVISGMSGWLVILASIQRNPWFVFTEHAFSDLGGPMSTDAWLFSNGMILTGFMIVLYGTYLVHVSFNKPTTIGAAFLMITGVFLTLIGVFHSGTKPHFLVSVLFFTMSDLSILAWGTGLLVREKDVLGKFFVGMGLLGPTLAVIVNWPSTAVVETFGILLMNIWVALMFKYPHEYGA
ncbi:DUF998 domain-containing protein [Candidatus Bathyarchaeota archaeon]|nr:DUF998 domain-containing protein [Candidatus Bathyarchaeota archaeon]